MWGHGGTSRMWPYLPLLGKKATRGSAEGRSPFAGGTGVSPVFSFFTPFQERKGDGGMVESAAER